MKLTLSRFLVENEGRAPNISPIKNHLKLCVDQEEFIYRGSESSSADFGEKEKREGRSSLTNSNIVLNFTSTYFSHLPDRKKSYFGTNVPSNATDFGSVFVIVPHDEVKDFAVIPEDFNLRDNNVLNEIQTGLNLLEFGYQFAVSIQAICRKLKEKKIEVPHQELNDLVTKITSQHQDIGEAEFEKLDELFKEVFSSGEPKKVGGYHNTNFANYVWEVASSKYEGSFIRFLKSAVKAGTQDLKVVPFEEALKIFKSKETYEIWFEGRCSYFSLDWLNEQYQKLNDDDDVDIVNDANDEDDIHSAIAEVFKQFL